MPLDTGCGFYWPDVCLSLSASSLLASFKLQQVCENQNCYNLIFADLLQVVETTCIRFLDKKVLTITCISLVDNLQQTCYHQTRTSDVGASISA